MKASSTEHPVLIYLHIPKTAGTSLRQVIARQYIGQPVYIFNVQNSNRMDAFLKLSVEERARLRCVMGHTRYGIHRYLSGEATYVTLLRHPVDLMISRYYFARSAPDKAYGKLVATQSLEAFIQQPDNGAYQVNYLAGLDEDQPQEPGSKIRVRSTLPMDQQLDVAKTHLKAHFSVVGLVEQFDESLLLMRRAFGWHNVYYARQRINLNRPALREITPELVEMIRHYARPDFELYDLAQELFRQQCTAYGVTLQHDLEIFRRRRALYERAWRVTTRLRQSPIYRLLRRQ